MTLRIGRIQARLLAEGIEIPVIGFQVVGTPNQTAVASIQIVPTPMAHRLPNRMKVDLFIHDLYAYQESAQSRVAAGTSSGDVTFQQRFTVLYPESQEQASTRASAGEDPRGGETAETIEVPEDLIRYRLLFTGEVMAIGYAKRPTDRAVILQCAGNSSYWDLVAADRRGGALFGGDRRTTFAGATQGPLWNLLQGQTGEIFNQLTEPPSMFPNVKGFTAGILHLMESIFGVYRRRTRKRKTIGAANQFMAMAELRLKLLQQVGVPGGDTTPLKLMRRQGFGSIWQPALRGLPRYFGFRQLLQALMPYTFMEHTPILAPHYTPPTGYYAGMDNWAGYDTGRLRGSPEWVWITQYADEIGANASDLTTELDDVHGQSEEEGVADSDEFSSLVQDIEAKSSRMSFLANEIYKRTSTTETFQAEVGNPRIDELENQIASGQALDPSVLEEYRTLVESPPATESRSRQRAIDRLESVVEWAHSIDRLAIEIYRRSTSRRTTLPERPDSYISDRLAQIKDLAKKIGDYSMPPPDGNDEDSDSEPAHLYTDILRPDVWFCAPPRSNVIFPDHVTSMSYNRIFGQEPTRLLVRMSNKLLGSHPFFDKWWVAPTAPGLFQNRPISRSGYPRTRIHRDLMDHELYGGVIPIFQSMTDRDMFMGARVTGMGASDATAVSLDPDQKRYFQQVTNFLLFKARFAARTMSVESRFNPYLICGFPSVVLDGSTDQTQTQTNQLILNAARDALAGLGEDQKGFVLEVIKNRVGTHYLGVIQQLTQTGSATGENSGTSIVLSYAREHNERIEFMGQDIIRLVQEASNRAQVRTVRQRSAEADRMLRELTIAAEEIGTYAGAFGSGSTYTGGLIQEPARQADFGVVAGQPRIFTGGSYQDAQNYISELMTELNNMPQEERRVTVQAPTTRASYVFALDPPIPRTGTPAGPGGDPPATDDYQPGMYGPNGGEIIEAVDVTDQYRNARRTRNVSGISAEERDIAEETAGRLQDTLNQDNQRLGQVGLTDTTPSADVPAQYQQDVTDVGELSTLTSGYRETVERYDAGWRQEFVTLPFLNSVRTARNRPVTTITTDKVGIETDVREIPQLVSIIGTDARSSTRVILRVYRITEDLQHLANTVYDMAAEDIVRPPWYTDDWTNGLIGGAVYMPYFGTGAIVDPIAVMRPDSINIFGQADSVSANIIRIRQQIQYQDFNEESGAMAGILEGATIENAVDFLAHNYSLTKLAGYDVESFIRNYTWRPIATMFDMFGSGDLQLSDDGTMVLGGVEGFHSRAFGPFANLFGLIPFNDVETFLGVNREDIAAAARVDVRGRRFAIVQAYRLELLRMRGCAPG